jgi:N6-L-threonylcarbamoyladenine synthase
VELEDPAAHPPFIALLVSGDHTLLLRVPAWGEYHLLGETRDDAAGEAFDKAAKLLGLPYPGGPSIAAAALTGDPGRHPLPRPLLTPATRAGSADFYDFSYSGLKTALRLKVRKIAEEGRLDDERPHLAAAFQEAAIEVLVAKTMRAVAETGCRRVALGGGVANNKLLRERLLAELLDGGKLFVPSPRLATDNAAMIARAARFRHECGGTHGFQLDARADLGFPGLVRDG